MIHVDKSAQRMAIEHDGVRGPVFAISTGRPPYGTPNGVFRPQRLERMWFSRKYYNSPMPYSIFFTKEGHAIHGSMHVKRLGGPASHGCVRISRRTPPSCGSGCARRRLRMSASC